MTIALLVYAAGALITYVVFMLQARPFRSAADRVWVGAVGVVVAAVWPLSVALVGFDWWAVGRHRSADDGRFGLTDDPGGAS
jgi:hypothetical protein